MNDKICPDAEMENRDQAPLETGTAEPVRESSINAGSESGAPETVGANEGRNSEPSSPEREPEQHALTPPESTSSSLQYPVPGPSEIAIESTPPASALGPHPVEWKGLDVLLFLLFSAVWLILSQFVSLAGYSVLRPLVGWRTPPSALVLNENAIFVVAAQLVFYAPVLLYVFLVVVLQYHRSFGVGIRWRSPGFRHGVRFLLAGMLLAMIVLTGSALLPDRRDFPMEKLFTSPSAIYAVGGLAVLIAPFMEELVFRGVLFSFFERLGGFTIAVPGTAVLFAALHYPEYAGAWTHVFMILVVGLVLSVARAMTGSLVPSFLLHTAYNATFIGLLFLGTHGFQNLHGTLGSP